MIKYLVFGGYINSQFDNDKHYISGDRLVELYGLKKSECKVAGWYDCNEFREIESSIRRELLMRRYPKAKILRPRYDGNYNLKERK